MVIIFHAAWFEGDEENLLDWIIEEDYVHKTVQYTQPYEVTQFENFYFTLFISK
jgi:hypothetical protein